MAFPSDKDLDILLKTASTHGATEATVVDAGKIRVSKNLAAICKEPGCPFYGQSASCPPHVGGPAFFRLQSGKCSVAIVVRIDVPLEILHSPGRLEVMALLHDLVSSVERQAIILEYTWSKGFAGGSCRELFCSGKVDCMFLRTGICRNPDTARPSMSGFGIDVGNLMKLAGWHEKKLDILGENGHKMSWVAGLILIG